MVQCKLVHSLHRLDFENVRILTKQDIHHFARPVPADLCGKTSMVGGIIECLVNMLTYRTGIANFETNYVPTPRDSTDAFLNY